MTASSQNLPEGQPPELQPVQPMPDAVRAAYAAYGVAIPAPAGPATVEQAPTEVTTLQAANAVVAAEMAKDAPVTPRDIVAAEVRAGVLFDAERAEEIASAARANERGKCAAELAAAQQDREAREWFHSRWRAVGQLCEGRPLDYCVEVSEVLTALDGRTPTTAPLTITWDGTVTGPSGDAPNENTLIPCTTARGGRAALVLNDEQRLALGGLLLAVLHTAEGCTTPGCGMSADDLDASDPSVSGWILVDVASTEGGPRWWCNPLCAQAAMAAGGAELAAADEAVGARCHRCGCTEDAACEGGCLWAPNNQNVDLCTQCVTPEELVYAVRVTEDGGL